jgi:hypothetical protein
LAIAKLPPFSIVFPMFWLSQVWHHRGLFDHEVVIGPFPARVVASFCGSVSFLVAYYTLVTGTPRDR